jgi:hypothetical protein
MWDNINDGDYAYYYNYSFTSFASAQVIQPDNSYQIHYYASSNGIGVADSGITCYATVPCKVAPYSDVDPGVAGQERQSLSYGTDGKLLAASTWTYVMNCPPPGVGRTVDSG